LRKRKAESQEPRRGMLEALNENVAWL
jgi:hypothetical protein